MYAAWNLGEAFTDYWVFHDACAMSDMQIVRARVNSPVVRGSLVLQKMMKDYNAWHFERIGQLPTEVLEACSIASPQHSSFTSSSEVHLLSPPATF